MSTPLEHTVEDFLEAEAKRRGGFTVKLNPKGYKGIPDRLVFLPNTEAFLVELKRPKGGVVAKLQDWWHDRLAAIGHTSHFCKTKAEVRQVLDERQGLRV